MMKIKQWQICLLLCVASGCGQEDVNKNPEDNTTKPKAALMPDALESQEVVDGWTLKYSERFRENMVLKDQQAFGNSGWLSTSLRGAGARIQIVDGAAHFTTKDFSDSALIGLTDSLPDEYKLRVKVGNVNYDIGNYERPEDFENPKFKYRWPDYIENGFYWLMLASRKVEPDSGEEFWHRYRKVSVDSDDHIGVKRPVYVLYMNPQPSAEYDRDKSDPKWIYGVPNLLRCWNGKQWNQEEDNWDAAFHYQPDRWYGVELEKADGQLVIRVFDALGKLLPNQETKPVDLDEIFGMGKQATEFEWAYFGEPHADSYEGDAWVDDIELWVRK